MDELISKMEGSTIKTGEENWDHLLKTFEKFEELKKNYSNISLMNLYTFFKEIHELFILYKYNFIDNMETTPEFKYMDEIKHNCDSYINEFISLQNEENLINYGYNTLNFIKMSVEENQERTFYEEEERLDILESMEIS